MWRQRTKGWCPGLVRALQHRAVCALCWWGGLGAAGATLPGAGGIPLSFPGAPADTGARKGRLGRGSPVAIPTVALVLSESPLPLWVPAVVVFFRRYNSR